MRDTKGHTNSPPARFAALHCGCGRTSLLAEDRKHDHATLKKAWNAKLEKSGWRNSGPPTSLTSRPTSDPASTPRSTHRPWPCRRNLRKTPSRVSSAGVGRAAPSSTTYGAAAALYPPGTPGYGPSSTQWKPRRNGCSQRAASRTKMITKKFHGHPTGAVKL